MGALSELGLSRQRQWDRKGDRWDNGPDAGRSTPDPSGTTVAIRSGVDIFDVLLRLTAAAVAGAVLGVDREVRGKPAGLRTHALVSVGAALVTMVSIELTIQEGELDANAVSRVIQGIIAGVGFLGGGAILKSKSRDDVRGLTTAASIWIVAALGTACGAGLWREAGAALVLSVLVLMVGRPVERAVRRRRERLLKSTRQVPRPIDADEDE
jgi:putative Mg2+ transporter-C (MgtC) family protein